MCYGARLFLLALFGVLAWAGAVVGQEPETIPEPPMPEGIPEMPYSITGEEVSYAVLAESLIGGLVHARNPAEVLKSFGLPPESPASIELIATAAKLEEWFSPRTMEEVHALLDRYEGDETGFLEYQRREVLARSRAVGEAFGAWLENRKGEGLPPEQLVERLLKTPYLSVSLGSDDSLEKLRSSQEARARAFEEGMRTTMREVPTQFQVDDELSGVK